MCFVNVYLDRSRPGSLDGSRRIIRVVFAGIPGVVVVWFVVPDEVIVHDVEPVIGNVLRDVGHLAAGRHESLFHDQVLKERFEVLPIVVVPGQKTAESVDDRRHRFGKFFTEDPFGFRRCRILRHRVRSGRILLRRFRCPAVLRIHDRGQRRHDTIDGGFDHCIDRVFVHNQQPNKSPVISSSVFLTARTTSLFHPG